MKILNDFKTYLSVYTKSNQTINTYVKGASRFLEFCNEHKLTPSDNALRMFIVHLKSSGLSDSTIATYYHGARAFLEFQGINVGVKPPTVVRKRIEDVPSIEEINTLIRRIPELRDKALIAVGYDTGARVNELRHIRIEDVDLNSGAVRIGRVKKRTAGEPKPWGSVVYHWVPLRSITIEILDEYLDVLETKRGWLFPGEGNKPIHENTVRFICYKWTEEILGRRYGPHKLFRHARGTHLAMFNVSPFVIRDLLGHSNVSTTDIYVRPLTVKELRSMLPPEVL